MTNLKHKSLLVILDGWGIGYVASFKATFK